MSRKYIIAGIAFLVGSGAPTIANYVLLAMSQFCGAPAPTAQWIAQAGIILMGVGFIAVLFLRTRDSYVNDDASSGNELTTYVVVSLLGGLVAILKAWIDAKNGNIQLPWSLFSALFIFAIVAAAFLVVGYTVSPKRNAPINSFVPRIYKVTVATLFAGCGGIAIQFSFLLIGAVASHGIADSQCTQNNLHGLFRYGTTAFFLSAPMTAFLYALCSMLSIPTHASS